MPKQPVSVTLDADNLLWLRAQAQVGRGVNVSQILDRLVSEARASGRSLAAPSRSVIGTVDLRGFDPAAADRALRKLFAGSIHRARLVREHRTRDGRTRRKRRA